MNYFKSFIKRILFWFQNISSDRKWLVIIGILFFLGVGRCCLWAEIISIIIILMLW